MGIEFFGTVLSRTKQFFGQHKVNFLSLGAITGFVAHYHYNQNKVQEEVKVPMIGGKQPSDGIFSLPEAGEKADIPNNIKGILLKERESNKSFLQRVIQEEGVLGGPNTINI